MSALGWLAIAVVVWVLLVVLMVAVGWAAARGDEQRYDDDSDLLRWLP